MVLTKYIFLGVTAMMVSLLLMPLAVKVSFRLNAIDVPDSRKVHKQPIPRLGGLAIIVAMLASVLVFEPFKSVSGGFFAGLLVVLLIGLIDDVRQLHPKIKLAGQVLAAIAFITISGVSFKGLGNLFGFGIIHLGFMSLPITIFVIAGTMNALNLSDGLDGLAGGLSAIACIFLGFMAIHTAHWFCLALIVALFGSLIGFLYYNEHPARIFMGDVGSLALGYTLAVVCVLMANGDTGIVSQPITLAIILGLPVADTLLVIGLRAFKGLNPYEPDKTHLHHRLLDLGIPHFAVVPLMYVMMAAYGLLAITVHALVPWMQLLIALALTAAIFVTVIHLQNHKIRLHALLARRRGAHHSGLRSRIAALSGKSIPLMTYLLPASILFPVLFMPPQPNTFNMLAIGVVIASLILFPWKMEHARSGWVNGLIYCATFILLLMLNLNGPTWVHIYLTIASLVWCLWVVIKVLFNDQAHIFVASGFELMMLLFSWFIPVFITQQVTLSAETEVSLVNTCIQSIFFLFAEKVLIRRKPRRNRVLLASLMCSLLYAAVASSTSI